MCSRCEDKPTDLPKKATLPSVQTDTMSIAEEDFNTAARFLDWSCWYFLKCQLSGDPSPATPRWAGTAASDLTRRPASALPPCPPGQGRPWVCSGVWWPTSRGQRRRTRGQEATWSGSPASTPGGDTVITVREVISTPVLQVRPVRDQLRHGAGDCQVQAGGGPQPGHHPHHHVSPGAPRYQLLPYIAVFHETMDYLGYILFGASLFSVWEVCRYHDN